MMLFVVWIILAAQLFSQQCYYNVNGLYEIWVETSSYWLFTKEN